MDEKQFEKLNSNIDEIWHKLEGIEHWLSEISEHGILSREIEYAIIAIARAQSKELDEEYKKQLNMKPCKV
jgi:hypothetical protein